MRRVPGTPGLGAPRHVARRSGPGPPSEPQPALRRRPRAQRGRRRRRPGSHRDGSGRPPGGAAGHAPGPARVERRQGGARRPPPGAGPARRAGAAGRRQQQRYRRGARPCGRGPTPARPPGRGGRVADPAGTRPPARPALPLGVPQRQALSCLRSRGQCRGLQLVPRAPASRSADRVRAQRPAEGRRPARAGRMGRIARCGHLPAARGRRRACRATCRRCSIRPCAGSWRAVPVLPAPSTGPRPPPPRSSRWPRAADHRGRASQASSRGRARPTAQPGRRPAPSLEGGARRAGADECRRRHRRAAAGALCQAAADPGHARTPDRAGQRPGWS